ncbi:MAG TPA: hypothetical protein ENN80_01880 [Candidatus Hydrogenedentes bacterium]|nr:hypothetical protein [Candidatus Hydrogenedentota bacterium]
MRVIADENLQGDTVLALRSAGHDVVWAPADMSGANDRTIVESAESEERVSVTFDKDFGELAFRYALAAPKGHEMSIGVLLPGQ